MTHSSEQCSAEKTITVRIPFKLRMRGGRKLVITPDGSDWRTDQPRIDNALVKALGRAFRWRRLLESGAYATTRELAAAEKINESYVCRLLRLTLLAPSVVEAILTPKQGGEMQMEGLLKPMSVEWASQLELLPGRTQAGSGSRIAPRVE